MPVLDFDPPDRFVPGTVGPAGQRTFFLQATSGRRTVTVSLEKQQVTVLGDRLNDLLDEVGGAEASEDKAAELVDNAPLDTPIEDEFRVGSMSLAWNAERQVVVVECHDQDLEIEEDDGEETVVEPDVSASMVLRVALEPARARAFARRCGRTVAGGRPNCPFCGGPLDPSGHICPRANGYKR